MFLSGRPGEGHRPRSYHRFYGHFKLRPTLSYLVKVLEQRKPRSVRIAALLDKPDRRLRPVKLSSVGFEIPDEFVVGYGLDYGERYRNLPDVCVLEGPHVA
jgi:hypoxanthine phosphoribosyltransferase